MDRKQGIALRSGVSFTCQVLDGTPGTDHYLMNDSMLMTNRVQQLEASRPRVGELADDDDEATESGAEDDEPSPPSPPAPLPLEAPIPTNRTPSHPRENTMHDDNPVVPEACPNYPRPPTSKASRRSPLSVRAPSSRLPSPPIAHRDAVSRLPSQSPARYSDSESEARSVSPSIRGPPAITVPPPTTPTPTNNPPLPTQHPSRPMHSRSRSKTHSISSDSDNTSNNSVFGNALRVPMPPPILSPVIPVQNRPSSVRSASPPPSASAAPSARAPSSPAGGGCAPPPAQHRVSTSPVSPVNRPAVAVSPSRHSSRKTGRESRATGNHQSRAPSHRDTGSNRRIPSLRSNSPSVSPPSRRNRRRPRSSEPHHDTTAGGGTTAYADDMERQALLGQLDLLRLKFKQSSGRPGMHSAHPRLASVIPVDIEQQHTPVVKMVVERICTFACIQKRQWPGPNLVQLKRARNVAMDPTDPREPWLSALRTVRWFFLLHVLFHALPANF